MTFRDCYAIWEDGRLRIGNALIERSYILRDGRLIPGGIVEKKTGRAAAKESGRGIPLPLGEGGRASFRAAEDDGNGLGEPRLLAALTLEGALGTQELFWEIFPELPFISFWATVRASSDLRASEPDPEADAVDRVGMPTVHFRVRSLTFPENSDYADTLLRESEELVYPRQPNRFKGDLFVLEPLTGEPAVILAKDAPAGKSHLKRPEYDLVTEREEASLYGTGADFSFFPAGEEIRFYGVTVGAGERETLFRAYRKLMASRLKGEGDLVVMANTWGDRNCEKMLGDAFIRDELRAAERLGADVLTIDDGWNKGAIDDPDRYMEHIWEGYHAAAPDYWSVDKKRFPQGFAPAAKEAAARGVSLGLWFCPDPADDFSGWEKDAAILEDFYRRYGIRYFKLDGITFRSKRGERNLCKLYDRLCRDGFRLQLDITALDRFGCRYMPQYGIQFVENRYTDWGNYHPFRTLRNLWMLSRLLPARSLQFEVLNPRRRQEKYAGDPFAPAGYDMDYLFAAVMASNPLLWFELSHLDEADAAPLRKILGIWRKHSRALYHSEVVPVGDEPDGVSFTGFACLTDEKTGYLILFRERSEQSEVSFRLPLPEGGIETGLLASNGEGETGKEIGPGGSLDVRFSRKDQYLFLGYRLL